MFFSESVKNKPDKFNVVTANDFKLYTLDGKELENEQTLWACSKFKNNDKMQFYRFVLDFKNVIILKLLG